ncbi:MAG: patatin-like phospholipase family protein [Anaerolineae bacterium]
MDSRRQPRIGMALSGGGLRGLAHLGVLQVLEEAQVPVDMLAGTSMGGIVAGLYGAGVPLAEIIAFTSQTGLIDLASPDRQWRGLFCQNKTSRLLAGVLGGDDVTFEDLKMPVTVVAANLETGDQVLLNQGPLIPALLATAAFPILFSPVRHRERWLVDGGVLNNLPVDVVRSMGANRVLAVSVPPTVRLSLESDEQPTGISMRGLRRFGSHTLDWKQPFLIAEASSSMTVQAVNRRRLAAFPPDLLLEIQLPNVGLFFAEGTNAAIIEAGRQVALDHRGQLLSLARPLPPVWWQRLAAAWRRLRRVLAALKEPQPPI